MEENDPPNPEQQARALFDAGRLAPAFTLLYETYGAELYRYLRGRNEALADDAFGETFHALWVAFPGFRWAASWRTWAYIIMRRTLARLHMTEQGAPVPQEAPDLEGLLSSSRGSSGLWGPIDARAVLARLGESFTAEDVDVAWLREISGQHWNAIALGQLPEGCTEAQVLAEAARLRKRYQRLRERLRSALGLDAPGAAP